MCKQEMPGGRKFRMAGHAMEQLQPRQCEMPLLAQAFA